MVMNYTQDFVDSLANVVQGRTYTFWGQILMNSVPLDLTGKTITAKIRQLRLPSVSLGATWENITVTAGNGDASALLGGVTFDTTLTAANFPCPTIATESEPYFVQYYVVEDDYTPQKPIFYVSRVW